jgi:hypothetical protein
MIKTQEFRKTALIILMIRISITLDIKLIPELGEKTWDEHLLNCFSKAKELNILKLRMLKEKVTSRDGYQLDYKGDIVKDNKADLEKNTHHKEEEIEDPIYEYSSFDLIIVELMERFKIAKNRNRAKRMSQWIVSRFNTNPFHNKCNGVATAIKTISLYLENRKLKIIEKEGNWIIDHPNEAKHFDDIKGLFLASLFQDIAHPGVSAHNFQQTSKENDFSGLNFLSYNKENEKCSVSSSFSKKKIKNLSFLFDFFDADINNETFNELINELQSEVVKTMDKYFENGTFFFFCTELQFSQLILARRFLQIFEPQLDNDYILLSFVQNQLEHESVEKTIVTHIEVAKAVEILAPSEPLRTIMLEGLYFEDFCEYFQHNKNPLIFEVDNLKAFPESYLKTWFSEDTFRDDLFLRIDLLLEKERNSIDGYIEQAGLKGSMSFKQFEPKEYIKAMKKSFETVKPFFQQSLIV